jgi:hypothetical protein
MKKLSLTLVGFFLAIATIFAPRAYAAITLDSSSTKAVTGGVGVFNVTSSITVGTGSNELLLLEVIVNNNSGSPDTVTSTINGVVPTAYYTATTTNAAGVTIKYFYLTGLSAGTYKATTTYNNQGPHGLVSMSSYFGVKQSNPFEATATISSNSNTINVSNTITTLTANDWLIDALSENLGTSQTPSPATGQTKIGTEAGDSDSGGIASYYPTSTVGAVKEGWTMSGAGSSYAFAQVAMVPAASVVSTTLQPLTKIIAMDW